MTNETVIGIDQSLVRTGVCVMVGEVITYTGTIEPKKLKGGERLNFIYDKVGELINTHKPRLLSIEGIGYNSQVAATMGTLFGIIQLIAAQKNIPLLVTPPTSLKLFATGNGRASKLEMVEAANKKFNLSLTEKENDIGDAIHLADLAIKNKP